MTSLGPTGFKILFIDDDDSQIRMYVDSIDLIKDEFPDIQIEYTAKSTYESGKNALQESIFDAAIVDLRLSGEGIEGNKIIREIKETLRFPVVVYSGFPKDLDPDLVENNCLFKVYNRTEKPFQEILRDLIALYRTGITNVFGKRGLIDESLNKIFWDHIDSTADYWITNCTENSEKTLLRYAMSHLHKYLELDENGDFETYHDPEVYIIPPIKPSPFTGDILLSNSDYKHFIILTPSCDLAQKKADQVAIAEIENIDMLPVKIAKSKLKKEDTQSKEIGEKTLKGLIHNSNSIRFHFLPPALCFPGGFINFQKIQSIEYEKIAQDYTRIASVADRFIKDIISHFSHYYARQGQPDLNFDNLYEMMLKL